MDFFERQDQAHKNTKRLVAYFVTGVLALVIVIYIALFIAFGAGKSRHRSSYGYSEKPAIGLWNPHLFLGSALGTLTVVLLGSLYKTAELSSGGSKVAEMLGGVPVNANTTDPGERRLLNIVEEMSIASGVPVPRVYILPKEGGINAFAAGFSTSDAVIGVTRGSVRVLTRDELQGVIAHEFSHILNGDMRLNIRLMGYVFGILCLTIIGRILLRTRGRKNPLPIVGLILIVTGWVGVFFGRLIQAAVSRQREYLADASAVQFTRNPEGLASALKKIGGLVEGSRLVAPQAAEASHLFFGNGLRAPLFGLMSTHPPLTERIRALDPSFDGRYTPVVLPDGGHQPPSVPVQEEDLLVSEAVLPSGQTINLLSGFRTTPGVRENSSVGAPKFVENIGSPNIGHLRYAEQLRAVIPTELHTAARETTGAMAIVFSMLLSEDPSVQSKQLEEIHRGSSGFIQSETLKLLPFVREAKARARLPIVDMVLPALRQLSPKQFQQFRTVVENLAAMDGEIDLVEYMVQKSILRHLAPYFTGARKPIVQYYSLRGLGEECAVLLSGLAHIGSASESDALISFQRGAEPLGYAGKTDLQMFPPDRCGLDMIDKALERLSEAAPQIKKNVMNACVLTIAADGIVTENEGELLRAISDSLDCPMPPLVPQA